MCRWIFSQWAIKELFVDQKDNVREWIFRSNLDRYVSVYIIIYQEPLFTIMISEKSINDDPIVCLLACTSS